MQAWTKQLLGGTDPFKGADSWGRFDYDNGNGEVIFELRRMQRASDYGDLAIEGWLSDFIDFYDYLYRVQAAASVDDANGVRFVRGGNRRKPTSDATKCIVGTIVGKAHVMTVSERTNVRKAIRGAAVDDVKTLVRFAERQAVMAPNDAAGSLPAEE